MEADVFASLRLPHPVSNTEPPPSPHVAMICPPNNIHISGLPSTHNVCPSPEHAQSSSNSGDHLERDCNDRSPLTPREENRREQREHFSSPEESRILDPFPKDTETFPMVKLDFVYGESDV